MFNFVMSQRAPLSGSNLLLKNRFSVPLSAKDISSTDISAGQAVVKIDVWEIQINKIQFPQLLYLRAQ
jgi:hypothetical protein